MPITQIPSNQVFPKQPKVFAFNNNTAVSGTWYTALNATGLRGVLSKVVLTYDGATGRNDLLEIRITIDGVVNTIGNPATSNGAGFGLNHGSNTANTYQATDSIDYHSNINILTSILVEFRQTSGVGRQLMGNIQYSTE